MVAVQMMRARIGTSDEWSTLVTILGTTYLFFWQASEEAEEEKSAEQVR
jgi:hypothetical protein